MSCQRSADQGLACACVGPSDWARVRQAALVTRIGWATCASTCGCLACLLIRKLRLSPTHSTTCPAPLPTLAGNACYVCVAKQAREDVAGVREALEARCALRAVCKTRPGLRKRESPGKVSACWVAWAGWTAWPG